MFTTNKTNVPLALPEKWLELNVVEPHTKDSVSMYDINTSIFLEKIDKIKSSGTYTISIPYRPDIYSNDIYGDCDYWFILLHYNGILGIQSLRIGVTLQVPSIADIESAYLSITSGVGA